MRAGWVLGIAVVLTAASVATAFEDPHGIGYDGRDWKTMTEQARLGYIAGFLAGTATQQAIQRHEANPKLSVDAALGEILRTHTAMFPFGVAVYKNDLDDYYFYRNNLPTKIYRALLDENAEMRKGPGSK